MSQPPILCPRKITAKRKKKMAAVFLSNANTFLPSIRSTSSSSSEHVTILSNRKLVICKAVNEASLSSQILSKRSLCISVSSICALALTGKGYFDANAAILEADDDEELLEKVKRDRKKRIERQGVIKSSTKETAYLQDLVYKLSKVGQAIENKDLSAASSVLGPITDTEWVSKIKSAFKKLSSSPEEKTEVDVFNSSLSSLISSASEKAFVASASALEKWTILTGLVEQLRGL
ncbi:thylakoid lumenal 16.5 kDa protein, chloroplastic-like isoform X2 [Olea europaea var. sylvestris]|uniref:thylakoid lumenal 16.5 kDa protein, chloroplastic-like isoform X2 n=1 Tax=Olea europaea var. sylvestris TaxID=158386 RepID=UPI000C1CF9A0|nr:thylakoid lumenal 16.5 kDa protein, chloroplastic-like isoform X2 [Olea europaea var. sylvestris]